MGIARAIVIHPDLRGGSLTRPPELMLAEAVRLVEAIGLPVESAQILRINTPRASTLLPSGALANIAENMRDDTLLVVNASLTPVQQRNLEQRLEAKTIDRTALILEIFGKRATTSAGRLQVELAALSFQRSRLVRSWTHLERQRGGGGFLGGPGERQIELDRRMLDEQILRIKDELRQVARTRQLQRQHRQRAEIPSIALIGYTNAGKSTLFNALTGAGVLSKDMLFATLDPTMRGWQLASGRQVILGDTVGFISQLPTELVEAFKSTLEEVVEADFLLHVHDASSPMALDEAADVEEVLTALGVEASHPRLHIFNKADLLESDIGLTPLWQRYPKAVLTSATDASGFDILDARLDTALAEAEIQLRIAIPFGVGDARAWLHEHGQILETSQDTESAYFLVRLSSANQARFAARWPDLLTWRQ